MVSSRRFAIRLAFRVALLLVTVGMAALLALSLRAPTATAIVVGASGVVAFSLWQLVNEGNVELARFVTALQRADLGQSFRRDGYGAGFDLLGSAYERAFDRLRGERADRASAARFAEALIDGTPVPLLVIGPGNAVRFVNKAARRLFGRDAPSSLDALAPFGQPFLAALHTASGASQLTHILLDGLSQRATLDSTLVETATGTRLIVSIKVVQEELDRAELTAQVDLVRVLTHEVMNSLTPVTSLAATALRLVGTLDDTSPGIADAQLAIGALARRAAELERFVDSYKGFSDTPVLRRAPIAIGPWLDELARLFAATPASGDVAARWTVVPGTPSVDGDVALLTQVMINLLKNAGEAMADTPMARVTVSAGPTIDGRIRIAVEDNGPGIPAILRRDVFLPFFTTKPTGTGIGLSFARQIVLLHGGQIGLGNGPGGCMELILPAALTDARPRPDHPVTNPAD